MSEISRKQITDLSELAGKTITFARSYSVDQRIVIAFDDDTFIKVKVDHWGDPPNPDINEPTSLSERVEMGVATPGEIAEMDRLRAEWKRRDEVNCIARERAEYERLRAMFGGGENQQ